MKSLPVTPESPHVSIRDGVAVQSPLEYRDPGTNPDLSLALRQLQSHRQGYDLYTRYFRGDHRLIFATYRWDSQFGDLFRELADNVCPAIVNTLVDKLRVTQFSLRQGAAGSTAGDTDGDGDPEADLANEIWSLNRLDQHSATVHTEAARCGDAYVIVGNDELGNPQIYPQNASQITVHYSSEIPGLILWACKVWVTSGYKVRLNMYYADRFEYYVSSNPLSQLQMTQQAGGTQNLPLLPSGFEPYSGPDTDDQTASPNPWGRVPVFHFPMNGSPGEYGISELHNVIPIQDMLNKTLAAQQVTTDFASFPQRWASGVEVDIDPTTGEASSVGFKPGIDSVWATASELTKFGQFDAADLAQFIEVCRDLRAECARVAVRPLHLLGLADGTGGNLSGETVNNLSKAFTSKIDRTQSVFGGQWADVMAFAVQMKLTLNGTTEVNPDALAPLPDFVTHWAEAETTSDKEKAEVANLWLSLGIPLQYILTERLGLDPDKASEIVAAKEAADAKAAADAQVSAIAIKGATAPGQDEFAPRIASKNL